MHADQRIPKLLSWMTMSTIARKSTHTHNAQARMALDVWPPPTQLPHPRHRSGGEVSNAAFILHFGGTAGSGRCVWGCKGTRTAFLSVVVLLVKARCREGGGGATVRHGTTLVYELARGRTHTTVSVATRLTNASGSGCTIILYTVPPC
jgi:hypothetical protein